MSLVRGTDTLGYTSFLVSRRALFSRHGSSADASKIKELIDASRVNDTKVVDASGTPRSQSERRAVTGRAGALSALLDLLATSYIPTTPASRT